MLRLYTFGRMDSADGGAAPCIVAAPQPLPAAPAAPAPAAPAAAAASAAEARAAGTALPDEESDFEEVGLRAYPWRASQAVPCRAHAPWVLAGLELFFPLS